jgi:hypothetical protein
MSGDLLFESPPIKIKIGEEFEGIRSSTNGRGRLEWVIENAGE